MKSGWDYINFSFQEVGRNKIILDRFMTADLKDPFVFWKISSTKKSLILKIIFIFTTLFSTIFWLYMIAVKSFVGSQYGFLFSVLSLFTLWFVQKNEISPQDALDRYHRARKELCPHEKPLS